MYNAKITGERIGKLRKEKNYTQAEMAESLRCSKSNYQKIETGKISTTIPMLMDIASRLNTSLDYLAWGNRKCADQRIQVLLADRSQEELEYVYRVLCVLLNDRPKK